MDPFSTGVSREPTDEGTPSSPPDSPLFANLRQASGTIDDLTHVLSTFSRGVSPSPTEPLSCCCKRNDCEHFEAFMRVKAKLEKGLVLSGEVGQALLQRHEAFARKHDGLVKQSVEVDKKYKAALGKIASLTQSNDAVMVRMAALVKESGLLDKRLTQTLLNLEVAESSNRTLLHEIQESRSTVARLNAQYARSVGWDTRLMGITQERDDLREERKSESMRAKAAESRAAKLAEKCAKLQAELHTAREEMETSRLAHDADSEELLKDAKQRLQQLSATLFSGSPGASSTMDAEVTRVLENLVGENEVLKKDNAELHNMLVESREDVKGLREDLEEQSVRLTPLYIPDHDLSKGNPPLKNPFAFTRGHRPSESLASPKGHRPSDSIASSIMPISPRDQISFRAASPLYPFARIPRRPQSAEPGLRSVSGGTHDETEDDDHNHLALPLSPPMSSHTPLHPHMAYEVDSGADDDSRASSSPPRARAKALMLLSRSRGVQTDPIRAIGTTGNMIGPYTHEEMDNRMLRPQSSPRPGSSFGGSFSTTPPPEGSGPRGAFTSSVAVGDGTQPSDTSSLLDPQAPPFTALHDRSSSLLTRIAQSDIRTLSNRLKRQHLDHSSTKMLAHISRNTLGTVSSDISALRGHFRGVCAEEGSTVSAGRKEWRGLVKLVQDFASEAVRLRGVLNEVLLDPSKAARIRDDALSGEGEANEEAVLTKGRKGAGSGGVGGWIVAPISKFFAGAVMGSGTVPTAAASADKGENIGGMPVRLAPKLAPAISASTTTVNVEFGSSGTKRAVSTSVGVDGPQGSPNQLASVSSSNMSTSTSTVDREQHLLGIFAGAPRAVSRKNNDWVVVRPPSQRPPRLKPSIPSSSTTSSITPDRSGFTPRLTAPVSSTLNPNRLSRIVDAVVEDPNPSEYSYQGALLQRTLRPRGLSDSSIHSTFVNDGVAAQQVQRLVTPAGLALGVTPTSAFADTAGEEGLPEAGSSGGGLRYLESLGKRMHGYTTSTEGKSTPPLSPPITLPTSPNLTRTTSRRDRTTSATASRERVTTTSRERATSAGSRATPSTPNRLDGFKSVLPAWVASAEASAEEMMKSGPGSYREESMMARTLGRGRDM